MASASLAEVARWQRGGRRALPQAGIVQDSQENRQALTVAEFAAGVASSVTRRSSAGGGLQAALTPCSQAA
jgi:hypothetical protein